jgi:transmembrane sensor
MDSDAIEARAAQWLLRRDAQEWTTAEQEQLDAWLEESTAHQVSFLRLEVALQQADRLKALRAGVPAGSVPPPGSWSISAVPSEPIRPPSAQSATPERRKLRLSVAAVLAFLLIGSLYLVGMRVRGEQLYTTRVGEMKSVRLADGSQVTLNTGTQIRVSLRTAERRVDLESGEAFFLVAKDHSRPFVLHVADKTLIAVGTAFSVRRSANTDIQVLVTEGRVQLRSAANRPSDEGTALNAGTITRTLNNEVLVKAASEDETERLLSWRGGFVSFHNAPLAEAVAEFNRYTQKKLIIADPSIAVIPIGGKFRSNNVDTFLALLQQGFPIEIEQSDNRIVLKRRP